MKKIFLHMSLALLLSCEGDGGRFTIKKARTGPLVLELRSCKDCPDRLKRERIEDKRGTIEIIPVSEKEFNELMINSKYCKAWGSDKRCDTKAVNLTKANKFAQITQNEIKLNDKSGNTFQHFITKSGNQDGLGAEYYDYLGFDTKTKLHFVKMSGYENVDNFIIGQYSKSRVTFDGNFIFNDDHSLLALESSDIEAGYEPNVIRFFKIKEEKLLEGLVIENLPIDQYFWTKDNVFYARYIYWGEVAEGMYKTQYFKLAFKHL